MRLTLLLLSLCTLECINVVRGICNVSRYTIDGNGFEVRCFNMTVPVIDSVSVGPILSIMIYKSRVPLIPKLFFSNYSSTVTSITLHDCGIVDVNEEAFYAMRNLKRISLSNNNITTVKEGWFTSLSGSLEQLDLSFNLIKSINSTVFRNLTRLQRLDISENQLTCLDPQILAPMGALSKIRFTGNPLNFRCRGRLTLWLHDHGVFYKDSEHVRDEWLDKSLWNCAMEHPKVAESENLIRECVLLNLFNQLRTGLTTSTSYPVNIQPHCQVKRDILMTCLTLTGRDSSAPGFSNGDIIKKLLLHLDLSKSAK